MVSVLNPGIYQPSGEKRPPSHYRPAASKATAPQIAAQNPNDSSTTKTSASPLLSHKTTALGSDRTDGVGSTATLQKSDGQARDDPIFLCNSFSLTGRSNPNASFA